MLRSYWQFQIPLTPDQFSGSHSLVQFGVLVFVFVQVLHTQRALRNMTLCVTNLYKGTSFCACVCVCVCVCVRVRVRVPVCVYAEVL